MIDVGQHQEKKNEQTTFCFVKPVLIRLVRERKV